MGLVGVKFLRVPPEIIKQNYRKITAFNYVPAGGLNINADQQMWYDLMIPGRYVDPEGLTPGDYDGYPSSSYFSLAPGEQDTFLIAMIFANGSTDQQKIEQLYHKLDLLEHFDFANFNFVNKDLKIQFQQAGDQLSGTVDIRWRLNNHQQIDRSILYYSDDNGDSWTYLGEDELRSMDYQWDTQAMSDGILYKLRIYTITEDTAYYSETDSVFTINNSDSNVAPQIYVTAPQKSDTLNGHYTIRWIGGDADGDESYIDLYYRLSKTDDWRPVAEYLTNLSGYTFDTTPIANSSAMELLARITAKNDTNTYRVDNLTLQNQRSYPDEAELNSERNSSGTGAIEVHVVNASEITGHDYTVLFDTMASGQTCYNVIDETFDQTVLTMATQVNGFSEGPYFDGLRLWIQQDTILQLNRDMSRWNKEGIMPYHLSVVRGRETSGTKRPADYKIVFGEVGVDTSKEINVDGMIFPAKAVNFKVKNSTEQKWIEFGFIEADETSGEGYFSVEGRQRDRICFLEENDQGQLHFTYWAYLTEEENKRLPALGDTLYLYQDKPFLPGDVYRFSTEQLVSIEDKDTKAPSSFYLNQNYPNPFNGATRIAYGLARSSNVSLVVYNILGQKVAELVDQKQKAGRYTVQWHPGNLASGVYVIVLQSETFYQTQKAIYLK